MLKGKKLLITGGAGFIGSTIASKLFEGNEIVLFDSFRRNALDTHNDERVRTLRVIQGDVTDFSSVKAAVDDVKPTHIVHAAGIAGIQTVSKRPVDTLEVNMVGTANLLKAAREMDGKIERVVTFSTSEIFGSRCFQANEQTPAEIGAVGEPRWVYAASKLGAEHLSIAHHIQYGLPTAVVRPFNVYGPGQVGEGALAIFVQRALRNEPITIHGDGSQIRAWCYVTDMVDAVIACLHEPGAVGKAFNVGNGRAVETILGLARQIVRVLESKSEITFVPKVGADIELRVPDLAYPREHIKYEPKVDLEEGIKLAAEFYRRHSTI
jgi:UDP-glucose 4-epimerase